MQLTLFRHLWGIDEPWETSFARIRDLGLYAGIETGVPKSANDRARLRALLDQHGFQYVPQIYTGGSARTVDEHLASFRRQIAEALPLKPRFVNAHSGLDAWPRDEARRFYREIVAIERDLPVPVAHETHRGRVFFHPWITDELIQEFPQLHLTADFSHWVCVAERLIDSEIEIVKRVAERTLHIHARVGFAEGPQVPDPRAPEYQGAVEAHERWWDIVLASQERRGIADATLTPEFGPPGYLHTLPYTRQPLANLWDICNWQAERQRARFAQRGARAAAAG